MQHIRLLIVDDDATSRAIMSELVDGNRVGIPTTIFSASTLEEAKEISLREKPHLTFMDLHFPNETVESVLQVVEDHMTPPVIICSATPPTFERPGQTVSILSECLNAGAKAYLEKGTVEYFNILDKWVAEVRKEYAPKTKTQRIYVGA